MSAAMRAVCGQSKKTGSCARPAARFSASRSADMRRTAGSAARRLAATINLPAASWSAPRATMPGRTPKAATTVRARSALPITAKVKSLASVTGRIGYAWERFLGYVKAGGAWERDDYWATTIILGTAYTARETRSGFIVGIGGEYAFTNFLSGFVEYNYFDFGTRQVAFTPQVAGLGPAFADVK